MNTPESCNYSNLPCMGTVFVYLAAESNVDNVSISIFIILQVHASANTLQYRIPNSTQSLCVYWDYVKVKCTPHILALQACSRPCRKGGALKGMAYIICGNHR